MIVSEPNIPRNQLNLARVVKTFQSDDGLVRSVKVQVGNRYLDRHGRRERKMSYLVRPIHKLILLVELNREIPHRRAVNVHRSMICFFYV